LDRFKHTQTGILGADQVAQWLGVERLLIGRATRNSAAEGQTASMSFVWGTNALVMYTTASPSITEPSACYLFERGGVETKRFREEAEGQDVIEAMVRTNVVVTASDAGYFFSSAVA